MLPSPSRIITMSDSAELVKALYPYNGEGQAVPLPFAETAILLVAERTKDGWCRGFTSGREGWFPGSYVKTLDNAGLVQVRTLGRGNDQGRSGPLNAVWY